MESAAFARDSLDARKTHFVEIDGIRTRYYEDGAGEPLVLIHGGNYGSLYSLDAWSLVLDALAARFHVYAFDKLGQGYTDAPSDPDGFTFAAVWRHADRLLERLNIQDAHLVGHSRGGLLAAWLAFERPGLARSLVVVDSQTLAADDPSFSPGKFYQEIEARTPPGPPSAASVRLEPDAQSFSTRHVTEDFVARMLAIAELPKSEACLRLWRQGGQATWYTTLEPVRAEALRRIDTLGLPVPTLVIWGYNDVSALLTLHGLPLFSRIAARTPRSELHVINEAGHYVFREQPEAFARAVSTFCGADWPAEP